MVDSSMNTKKMRVVYIIDDLQVGGAQVHLLRLVELMSNTFSISVVSLGKASLRISSPLKKLVPIYYFDMQSIRNTTSYIFSFCKLVRYLRKYRPHIVHTYLNSANVFGTIASKMAGVKYVITSRRDMGHFRTGRLAKIESFLSRTGATAVFCVCDAVAKATRNNEKISERMLHILVNGVDTKRFYPVRKVEKKDVVNFMMVAAMNRTMKGHADVIQAIYKVDKKLYSKLRLYLVGDGPLRRSLETLVKRLQLEYCVKFIGEQTDIFKLLKETDVLIAPSHSEGISNAILEAMATGIPIIATAVDGNIEVVEDGKNGILVPIKDPLKMAEAITNYLSNESRRLSHGKNARARVEKYYSYSVMYQSYRAAYNQITMAN